MLGRKTWCSPKGPLPTCNLSRDVWGYTLCKFGEIFIFYVVIRTWQTMVLAELWWSIKYFHFLCGDPGVGQNLKSPTDRLLYFHVLFLSSYHPVPSIMGTPMKTVIVLTHPHLSKQKQKGQCLGRHQVTAWPKCAPWRQSRSWSRVSSKRSKCGVTTIVPRMN